MFTTVINGISRSVKFTEPVFGPINTAFYFMSVAGFICRDTAYKYLDAIDAPDETFDDYFKYFRIAAITLGSIILAIEIAGNFSSSYYAYRINKMKALVTGASAGAFLYYTVLKKMGVTDYNNLLAGSIISACILGSIRYVIYKQDSIPVKKQETIDEDLKPFLETETESKAKYAFKILLSMAIWASTAMNASFIVRGMIKKVNPPSDDYLQFLMGGIGAIFEPTSKFLVAPLLVKCMRKYNREDVTQQDIIYRANQFRTVIAEAVFARRAMVIVIAFAGVLSIQDITGVDATMGCLALVIALSAGARMIKPLKARQSLAQENPDIQGASDSEESCLTSIFCCPKKDEVNETTPILPVLTV